MGAFSLRVFNLSLWSGFQRSAWKRKCALFLCMGTVSATRWVLGEMYSDDVP